MIAYFLTAVGAFATAQAENDNQRAIGAVMLGVGLNIIVRKVVT